MERTFKLAAIVLAVVAVFATGCRKDNPNYEFIGEYHVSDIKFNLRLNTSSGTIDLPTVTLKEVSLDLKRLGKEKVTGTFKFGSARGNSYSVKGECSGDIVVFDEFTINLDNIFTNDGEVNFDLTLDCVGTLNGNGLKLNVSYSGSGSITENGSTNSGDLEDGVVNVSLTKQGNNNSNHEYVDLGLPSGTLWATCNVGANFPWEYGDYFAWGETETKDLYSWETYKFGNGGYKRLTKYCGDANYGYNGFTDSLTRLLPEDDAATANWGSQWKTPTEEQCCELLSSVAYIWTVQNGAYGLLFSASNGNSLFLPAGHRYDGSSCCAYWANGYFYNYDPTNSFYMQVIYDDISMHGFWNGPRYKGLSVRPVRAN